MITTKNMKFITIFRIKLLINYNFLICMSPEYSTKFSLVFQGEKKSETIIKFQSI